MKVILDWHEVTAAATIGIHRRVSSLQKQITDRMHSRDENPWQIDIEGACAELACAKALGVYWGAGVDTFKSPDIGHTIQVRSTSKPSNRLIIRENDPDDEAFILVVGKAPAYEVRGWILGREGKKPEWVKDANGIGKPAYFIPTEELKPLSTLRVSAVLLQSRLISISKL